MLRWNKNIEIVSGYSAEEIDHMRARDFIALDDQETVLLNKSLAIQSGESGFEANFTQSKNSISRINLQACCQNIMGSHVC